jgi:hypothetical protein
LYYLQSRYYNPEWGRFINADGLVGIPGELLSSNMFAYCIDNPVNMSDPDGDRPAFDSAQDEQDYHEYMLSIKYGEVDLGPGYNGRVDPPHVPDDQDHVHINKGNKEVANQNADGTPHHKNKNKEVPTNKVKKKLKEKSGWDWDGNAAKQSIAKGVLVTGGAYVLYRGVRMIPSLIPPLWWTIPANAVVP